MSDPTENLNPAAPLTGTELIHVVQGGNSRKATVAELVDAVPPAPPGGNIMAVGLFTALAALAIPLGTTLIQTSGHSVAGKGHAIYVEDTTLDDAAVTAMPQARVKTQNNRYFRLSYEQFHNPQMLGALADDDIETGTDDYLAFTAARDFLQSIAIDPSAGGYYTGTPHLDLIGCYFLNPAAHGATSLDFFANTQLIGHGSGRSGPGGGAASQLRFGANSHGLIPQFPNTNGVTGVDAGTHKGTPGFTMRGFKIKGSFAGAEGDWHGFVPRTIVNLDDIYIYNWPGEGIKGWAGNVIGVVGTLSGNLSTSSFRRVKIEGCRGAADMRGGDANVINWTGCEFYQNRWFGYLDDNGAGSNTVVGCHAASNGVVTGVWAQTQCSYVGYRYAARQGGDPTIAPSGTTDDTANWWFIEAGGVVANLIPAWVNTPGTFRSGGDYLTLNNAGVVLLNCYSEYGTFSQFNATTRVIEGTIGDQYFRGGTRDNSGSGGYRVRQFPNAEFVLQHHSTEGDFLVEDELGVVHSRILFSKSAGNYHGARDITGHVFQTAPYNGAWTTRCSITTNGVELPAAHAVYINGQQVVGARRTGWTAATGTATRTTFDTAAVTLPQLAEHVKAVLDDLIATGAIGA